MSIPLCETAILLECMQITTFFGANHVTKTSTGSLHDNISNMLTEEAGEGDKSRRGSVRGDEKINERR